MPRLLMTPEPLRGQPGAFRDILREAGFEVVDAEGPGTLTAAEVHALIPDFDAAIAGGERYDAQAFARAPRLRAIARTGVGYDAIDVPAATRHGVAVTITPGTNQESVAEQAFGLLLSLTRNIAGNDRTIRAGGWNRTLVQPLRGKTLGLVGLGRIGRAMATRARAFGMRVVAYDLMQDPDFDAQHGVGRMLLDDLLAQSDVVSLHLPMTEQTAGLIRRETLARMRPGSYLINTARGGLIVEADLAEALASGHLAGAGLDVLESEPPAPDNPLLRAPNVLISPHVGGIDTKSMADMAELAARCIVRLHRGDWPGDCVVNPEIGPGWIW